MNKITNEKVAKVSFVIVIVTSILLAIMISFAISKCLVGYFQKDEIDICDTEKVEETENKRGSSSVIEDSLKDNDISTDKKTKVQQEGWTIENINVREHPNTKASILGTIPFNTYIKYYEYNDEWTEIIYKNKKSYISRAYISNEECSFVVYDVPKNSGFKSYMPYTAITDKSSKQYKLQQIASTNSYGIRYVNNRYLVAIGTAFNANVGTYVDIILTNDTVIPCIVADIKSNKHTDSSHMVTKENGCLTEFVVDSGLLNKMVKRMGDISYCFDEWESCVENIKVYEKNIFKEGE